MLESLPPSLASLLATCPLEMQPAGARLQRRGEAGAQVCYLQSGRVLLGLADGSPPQGALLAHQLGSQTTPGWLDATAAVLDLPAAMDAVAETPVQLRTLSLAVFRAALPDFASAAGSVLRDLALAHRQQTELAVSRLAKDAEARCAEWLLSQAQSGTQGSWAVQLQQRKRLIAAQLGIAPETLSRVLRHLRERQLISGSGRTVHLVDPAGLRSLAEL